ncbi:hypothetical protein, partial [Zavarzinella formosa]|uniref:hypothetical protein n=1 Tax=Zavarzinella formosa TaxID=360055 RepID=UPI0004969194
MIVQEGLPGIKQFLRPAGLSPRALGLVIRCVAAFCLHWGRMSASQASGSVASEPRHRAQISRFLGRKGLRQRPPLALVRDRMLALEPSGGRFV